MSRSTIQQLVVTGLVVALVSGCVMFRGDCRFKQEIGAQTVDTMSADRVQLDVGAGTLRVEGMAGLTELTVFGEACSSRKDLLPDIAISVTLVDGTLHIESVFPDVPDESFGIDVVVKLPEGLHVTVNDGSGSMEVTGVAGAEIRDGSGSIELRDISGDVTIHDGSGSVTVERVTGDVWLRDGSGSIDIRNIGGSVNIEEDGSGGIKIREVAGDVLVSVDGSGSIEVREVGGDFTVREGGSGRVHFSGIEGRVHLPDG